MSSLCVRGDGKGGRFAGPSDTYRVPSRVPGTWPGPSKRELLVASRFSSQQPVEVDGVPVFFFLAEETEPQRNRHLPEAVKLASGRAGTGTQVRLTG